MPSGQLLKRRYKPLTAVAASLIILLLILRFVPISTKHNLLFPTDGICPKQGATKTKSYHLAFGQRSEFDEVESGGIYYDDICSYSVKHRLYLL